jgi:hypothetical protein
MSTIFENNLCYFCDESFPYVFIENCNGVYVCFHCHGFRLPINFNSQENGECYVCFENKLLLQLKTCTHTLCFECCKTIYFGSSKNDRPIHWREITDTHPIFPYESTEEHDDTKQEDYYYFEDLHYDYEKKTYDELIKLRDSLIIERPEWMNTETFIHY